MKQKRLTQSSLGWAAAIAFGLHTAFEKKSEEKEARGGCAGILEAVFEFPFRIPLLGWFLKIPLRLYFAAKYMELEGVWLVWAPKGELELHIRDFDEPESLWGLISLWLGLEDRSLVKVKKVKASTVDIFETRRQGFWTELTPGQSSGTAELMSITVAGDPERSMKRIIKAALEEKKHTDFDRKVDDQVDFDLEVEKRKAARNAP